MSPKTATATVRVKINSVEVEVPADATALQALRLAGFDVPSACYDPRLKPGMTLDEARPIIATIAAELMGPQT